ncbi:Eco57I restriction-modification methylase domain-containing protein [Plantactinospora sp. WMMB334]|uniref:Eco57I restriction-modification methylase domain-containing protein n=1 Tax=Plantactinospora sp. WMMB334 TaxID=3404119 RepID=UPI003B9566AC
MTTPALFDLDPSPSLTPPCDTAWHGEVFTRQWVVETILDLVGYTPERDLASLVIVEPACGAGAFLGPIVARLSASCRTHGRPLADAAQAIRAFDLREKNIHASRVLVTNRLLEEGWDAAGVEAVVDSWLAVGDYLLRPHLERAADFVVGNPPYLRIEDVPDSRMAAYRSSCHTMTGRADIYVGFYEVALRALRRGGKLGFICADRWMHNQYGKLLRQLVARHYSMDLVLRMHDVDAFHGQVSAYPAITVISNSAQRAAVVGDTGRGFGERQAEEFRAWVADSDTTTVETSVYRASRLTHWHAGGDSWPTASPARLAVLNDLEGRLRPLEDPATRTRVGIGVATGADRIFVTNDPETVEQDRLLPLAMVRDTASGKMTWGGSYLVNPWSPDGDLVDLADHPRLAAYLRRHQEVLRRRYIATRQPERWYKTIDKVDHRLCGRPKLLFPDMKQTIHPVLDSTGLYPHHNLYYIVSDDWDLRVLGGILLSRVAQAFVEAYAVRMRGGTLRFQAQYLRRIRVPSPSDIASDDRAVLADAFDRRDVATATQATLRAYGLSELPD